VRVVVVGFGSGKRLASSSMFAWISARIAARSTGLRCGGSEVGFLGVTSSIEGVREVVGRGMDADCFRRSDTCVEQVPLQ